MLLWQIKNVKIIIVNSLHFVCKCVAALKTSLISKPNNPLACLFICSLLWELSVRCCLFLSAILCTQGQPDTSINMCLLCCCSSSRGFVHSVYHRAVVSDAEEDTLTTTTAAAAPPTPYPLCVLDPTLYHKQQIWLHLQLGTQLQLISILWSCNKSLNIRSSGWTPGSFWRGGLQAASGHRVSQCWPKSLSSE